MCVFSRFTPPLPRRYFIPAYGRLPEPHYTGPPIPGYNETHDQHVAAWRIKLKGQR